MEYDFYYGVVEASDAAYIIHVESLLTIWMFFTCAVGLPSIAQPVGSL
ncbi:hypothetical protein [Gloeobacter kilaueensis]|uniref:Uncharacterized protein n=1 Tax=Gloeobacter kilaueensis (strain ATCC BAA-2537 / CCAP 1431/1 / ULC 316 / JS1) TaxID=1183438 RepID=U5QG51_GLOK1|nr:hypothetical protein [Gloeobacter kilaueensis]AGY56655.1 hypothetical protein GKIL_0409 [Gloeobacter kilaueensis JS1]